MLLCICLSKHHDKRDTMKLGFDIYTTSCKPLLLYVDEDTTTKELVSRIVYEVENFTMITEETIQDIFMCNQESIVSLYTENCTILEFMYKYCDNITREKTRRSSVMYSIYIIDDLYLQRRKENKPTPVYNEDNIPPPTNNSLLSIIKNGVKIALWL